jgi:hypothetical protein
MTHEWYGKIPILTKKAEIIKNIPNMGISSCRKGVVSFINIHVVSAANNFASVNPKRVDITKPQIRRIELKKPKKKYFIAASAP